MLPSAQPKWTITGLIEAPVEQVWQALLEINPYLSVDDKQALAQADSPQHFTATVGYARTRLEVDKQRHSIADQGEWWYRGVQTLEPHERGSLLVYRVYNIAPDATRWLVPFVVRRFDVQMRDQLVQILHEIGERLHCPTAPIA